MTGRSLAGPGKRAPSLAARLGRHPLVVSAAIGDSAAQPVLPRLPKPGPEPSEAALSSVTCPVPLTPGVTARLSHPCAPTPPDSRSRSVPRKAWKTRPCPGGRSRTFCPILPLSTAGRDFCRCCCSSAPADAKGTRVSLSLCLAGGSTSDPLPSHPERRPEIGLLKSDGCC